MNNLPQPKCAVIIPCFNYARFVETAIRSIQAQSLSNFECIIVDDGSTDDSIRVISEAIKHDLRFSLLQKTNGGVASARNYGIAHSSAPYICCLDADDVIAPNFLETVAAALDADPTLGIAYTGLTIMTEDGTLSPQVHTWPPEFNFEDMAAGRNCIPTCCGVRHEAWRRAGGYRTALIPCEDANLWLRITAAGYRARKVTEDGMFHYRVHSGSLSRTRASPRWNDFAWVTDYQRPFAAPPANGRAANPVRNYDKPQVTFVVEVHDVSAHELEACLDSIENQSFRFWECILASRDGDVPLIGRAWVKQYSHSDVASHIHAPLVAYIEQPDSFDPDYLKHALKAFQRTGESYEENGVYLCRTSKWLDPHAPPEDYAIMSVDTLADIIRVEYTGERGMIRGVLTNTWYGIHDRGDMFYVWTKDAQAAPDVLKPVVPIIGVPKTKVPPKPKRVK